jgi:hypothetical protein
MTRLPSLSVALLLATLATAALARERVFVLTDIANEPDDEQSLVRFLVYANEYDVEGLVATTSTWLRKVPREDLIRRQLDAYEAVRDTLLVHAAGYPTADELRAVTATGQPHYGLAAVGPGQGTPGSRLLLAAADRPDPRPLWVTVWGGANTLAQALHDARADRSPEELDALVARLRVSAISDQDDAGHWLRREFPGLYYVVSPSTTDWLEYWRSTWSGISGDRHYRNGPFHHFELVDNPWLEEHVIQGHGPLGALYPRLTYIMEGDTPSFLGLIPNGLGWAESPGYGGWGGRYVLYRPHGESRPIWTNNHESRDTVTAENGEKVCSDQATIWRWRRHFQHDFAARMDWCVAARFADANHNPVAVLNGDATRGVVPLSARSGAEVTLSAAGSSDPDGDPVRVSWFVYREAGTVREKVRLEGADEETVRFTAPTVSTPATLHVILQLEDRGSPALFAYRRAIVTIEP